MVHEVNEHPKQEQDITMERCSIGEAIGRICTVLAALIFLFGLYLLAGLFAIWIVDHIFNTSIIAWIDGVYQNYPVISIIVIIIAFLVFTLYFMCRFVDIVTGRKKH